MDTSVYYLLIVMKSGLLWSIMRPTSVLINEQWTDWAHLSTQLGENIKTNTGRIAFIFFSPLLFVRRSPQYRWCREIRRRSWARHLSQASLDSWGPRGQCRTMSDDVSLEEELCNSFMESIREKERESYHSLDPFPLLI